MGHASSWWCWACHHYHSFPGLLLPGFSCRTQNWEHTDQSNRIFLQEFLTLQTCFFCFELFRCCIPHFLCIFFILFLTFHKWKWILFFFPPFQYYLFTYLFLLKGIGIPFHKTSACQLFSPSSKIENNSFVSDCINCCWIYNSKFWYLSTSLNKFNKELKNIFWKYVTL